MKALSFSAISKKVLKGSSYLLYLVLSVVLLFELAYRNYWFDYYQPELKGLNKAELLSQDNRNPTILACGDSFTGNLDSYVADLRTGLPHYRVINAGVPGSGIIQTAIQAPSRIQAYKPEIFIYQIYIGNDLLDIRHPWRGKDLSPLRKLYWLLTDHLRSLAFLNYRFAGIRYQYYTEVHKEGIDHKELTAFSPQTYSFRQKLYFQAEPKLVENTVFLQGKRARDMDVLINKLQDIRSVLPSDCQLYILVFPHCMQVNSYYRDHMLSIGARLSVPDRILQEHYPFVDVLNEKLANDQTIIVNTLPILRQNDRPGNRLYYENDPHLKPWGHRIVGTYLKEMIN